MGFGRQERFPPVGVVSMASWLVLLAVRYMRWRGEIDDGEVEAIRRTMQETV